MQDGTGTRGWLGGIGDRMGQGWLGSTRTGRRQRAWDGDAGVAGAHRGQDRDMGKQKRGTELAVDQDNRTGTGEEEEEPVR